MNKTNFKSLTFLSKALLFFLPILITIIFLCFCFLQYNNSQKTIEKIDDTKDMIAYLEAVLSDEDKINDANLSATIDLLNNKLHFNLTSFESYFNYNIFLIAPDGTIYDIIDILTKEKAAADADETDTLTEPLEYTHSTSGIGNYSLLIIESSTFINGTNDSTLYEFPEELFERNAQRISNMTERDLISNPAEQLKYTSYAGNKYSLIEIKFSLTEADKLFELILPLNWFKNLTCQSITVEAD